MKFDRRNKFDFCYYGQANSLQLNSSASWKWARKHLWGGGGGGVTFILLAMVLECAIQLPTSEALKASLLLSS